MIKSTGAAFIYMLAQPMLPHFLSVISSIVVIVYFISMLKLNVVDKKYQGKWKAFFKAWFKIK